MADASKKSISNAGFVTAGAIVVGAALLATVFIRAEKYRPITRPTVDVNERRANTPNPDKGHVPESGQGNRPSP